MSHKPTNVTRLERDLCRAGFTTDGFSLPLDPTANDEGHLVYDEILTIRINGVRADFHDRYSERAVQMYAHMPPANLVEVAKTLAERETKRLVGIDAIVPVGTAVAVCDTLRHLSVDGEG